ncbi:mRNA cap guanine-N(7) methyltransferase 2 isoform X1 [Curcuma longa]|uniref:mRNA cap guanine-N(7) methyltransferase 2 isoform X1 n=1 Tax=Curcuma longa TaxID=136217 RepID=UPI003D9ECCE5
MASAAPVAVAAPQPPPPASFLVRPETARHRLYDFAKTALIKIFAFPYATVCELYCGGAPDTDKWDDAQIGHYVGIDSSCSGITRPHELSESQRKPYTAEFCELDPYVENLESHLHDKGIPADIVCCFQNLQSCFESEEKAASLLKNVSSLLKPGGYFFGITPDSSTIWTKYQKNVEASHNKGIGMKANSFPSCIRSENYIITFEVEEEKFPFFGKKYQIKFANEITSETHCLVHFASLIRLARDAGLDYVEIQNLAEFYDDNRSQFVNMLFSYGGNFMDPRGRLLPRTLDLLGLYSTFVFQKPDPDAAPPIMTPLFYEGMYSHEEQHEWPGSNWRQQPAVDEDRNGQTDTNIGAGSVLGDNDKGILGPGPADLRFPDPL